MASLADPTPSNGRVQDVTGTEGTISVGEEEYSVLSTAMRTYLTYFLGFVSLISTLTATIYAPLIPMLSTHYVVSIQDINLTVTTYSICQALFPSIFASLADVHGRRPTLLVLLTIYTLASLGLALNQSSYVALVALRALQSIGGSATITVAYGIVADVAPSSKRGEMLGPMLSTCNGVAAIGPVVGGAVAFTTGNYAGVFWALLVLAVVLLIIAGFTLPETARNIVGNGSITPPAFWRPWHVLLYHRRNGLRQHMPTNASRKRTVWRPASIFASLRIFFYPDAAAVLWIIAASYSIYSTLQAAIPTIFDQVYEYNELYIGLVLSSVLAGLTVGGLVAGRLMDYNYRNMLKGQGISDGTTQVKEDVNFPIEYARYHNCLYFILFETALTLGYGWVVQKRVHPSVSIVLQFLMCATSTVISHTASALLVDMFPERSSTAYAAGQVARCSFAAASVAVLQPFVDATGRGWYFTAFGLFIGGSSSLSLLISFRWGLQWRLRRHGAPNRDDSRDLANEKHVAARTQGPSEGTRPADLLSEERNVTVIQS